VKPPPVQGTPYTVQTGDTLYSIAKRYGMDWRAIVDANPTINPSELCPGQVILIPGGGETTPPPTPPPITPPVTPPEEAPRPLPPPPVARNPGHPGPIPAEARFIWPVRGNVLSRFRQPMSWRMNELNYGIDIRATPGEAVVAAKSGLVNTFTKLYGYGKVVVLVHQDHTTTFYGHLGEILVTHGTWVKQGEIIGTAGSTGQSSGTELHFRVMQGDRFIDPMPQLMR
jgi:lipoprotein NlpD